MIDLRVFEKSFLRCSYLILLILLRFLYICIIWLSRLIRLSQSVSVLSCTWKIKSDEILYSLYSNVCLIYFKKYSCDHCVLKLHRDCTSDFNNRFIWYVCIFDTWSIIWDDSLYDKAHSVWACFERVVLHQWACWSVLMRSYSWSSMSLFY